KFTDRYGVDLPCSSEPGAEYSIKGDYEMRKLMTGVFALFGLVALTTISFSEGAHTPDQAKAFVEKAVTFYKTAGREKALAVFSDPKGEFVEGDLYIFVMDMKDGKFTTLAHG